MKVFISSVRRGLEAERDSLPGLIRAIGLEPVRFEDFSALPTPSREACMRGVAAADVYLLLLGPHYGHVFPETGQSATHDEWIGATTKGIPRLVFRKSTVTLEPDQERFAREVGDYGVGVFYAPFESAVDLQAKVVTALRALADAPSALNYQPLSRPVPIEWRADRSSGYGVQTPLLTVHVRPLDAVVLSHRVMTEAETNLPEQLRRIGAIPAAAGVSVSANGDELIATWTLDQRRRFGEVRNGDLVAVRLSPAGQLSWSWTLPGDGLGTILNSTDLAGRIASSLRFAGAMRVAPADRYVIAVELTDVQIASEGELTAVARQSASFGIRHDANVKVEPDESVSDAALSVGASEAADVAAKALLRGFRRSR